MKTDIEYINNKERVFMKGEKIFTSKTIYLGNVHWQ
jgi:hypothetical protein